MGTNGFNHQNFSHIFLIWPTFCRTVYLDIKRLVPVSLLLLNTIKQFKMNQIRLKQGDSDNSNLLSSHSVEQELATSSQYESPHGWNGRPLPAPRAPSVFVPVSANLIAPEICPLLTDSQRETFQYESFSQCTAALAGNFTFGTHQFPPPPELNGFPAIVAEKIALSVRRDICCKCSYRLDGTPVIIVKWNYPVLSQNAPSATWRRPPLVCVPLMRRLEVNGQVPLSAPVGPNSHNRVELKGVIPPLSGPPVLALNTFTYALSGFTRKVCWRQGTFWSSPQEVMMLNHAKI